MIQIGEKIRTLRKQRNISQETLANYLGVSFQAVSKWETETAMPDITMIPAIASFFGVSTDELFDYNRLETEKKVKAICDEAYKYRITDPTTAEKILREGLKQFPGNEILLNNLLYVIDTPERTEEGIEICKALIESAQSDEVKYDAIRILALIYKALGEYSLVKATIEKLPEIYFTKLGVAAALLEGEDMFESAVKQKSISFEDMIDMCELLAKYYRSKGETEKAKIQLEMAKNVIFAAKDDFATPYTKRLFEAFQDRLAEIEAQIAAI